jgi:hypothetical protein
MKSSPKGKCICRNTFGEGERKKYCNFLPIAPLGLFINLPLLHLGSILGGLVVKIDHLKLSPLGLNCLKSLIIKGFLGVLYL